MFIVILFSITVAATIHVETIEGGATIEGSITTATTTILDTMVCTKVEFSV